MKENITYVRRWEGKKLTFFQSAGNRLECKHRAQLYLEKACRRVVRGVRWFSGVAKSSPRGRGGRRMVRRWYCGEWDRA